MTRAEAIEIVEVRCEDDPESMGALQWLILQCRNGECPGAAVERRWPKAEER